MTQAYEVKSIQALGIHQPEYCFEPEQSTTEYFSGYKAPNTYSITEIQDDTAKHSHFLIKLIHRWTDEEKLVDLLTDTDKLSSIRTILNCHFDWNWGIFEVQDLEEPF